MIIEFCGTPGCGKTTVAHALQEKLIAQGYTVVNIHEKERSASAVGRLQHYAHSLAYRMYGKSSAIRRALETYIANNETNGAAVWTNCILENVYSTDINERKYDFVLMDEGVIQFLSSLGHDHRLTEEIEPVMALLRKLHYDRGIFVAECFVDTDENIRRIIGRGRQGDRFLQDSGPQARALLNVKQQNIDRICSCLDPAMRHPLDTVDRDEAVNRLLEYIRKDAQAADVRNRVL